MARSDAHHRPNPIYDLLDLPVELILTLATYAGASSTIIDSVFARLPEGEQGYLAASDAWLECHITARGRELMNCAAAIMADVATNHFDELQLRVDNLNAVLASLPLGLITTLARVAGSPGDVIRNQLVLLGEHHASCLLGVEAISSPSRRLSNASIRIESRCFELIELAARAVTEIARRYPHEIETVMRNNALQR